MNKLLILGSVVSPCPPKKQGGTERVAYYQAKQLAKFDLKIIFVGAIGTKQNFAEELDFEKEPEKNKILDNIEFVEIGGGTGFGSQEDAKKIDLTTTEASRKLRLEMINLATVEQLMIDRKEEYKLILNNLRGEAALIPLARLMNKTFVNVMHLNIFEDLAEIFRKYKTHIITISKAQRAGFSDLNYLANIYNPINPDIFKFGDLPKNYALMMSTIGRHKNQVEAIEAAKKANIRVVISGKIRDSDYFEKEIKPLIDEKNVTYVGELDFEKKVELYNHAKVFLFPIKWNEPFGLVVIEALVCGVPVIAYPHGGPGEIIEDGVNGYLVNNVDEMASRIEVIDKISRKTCRENTIKRFSDKVIGKEYFEVLKNLL